MKNLLLSLIVFTVSCSALAQKTPRFAKFQIKETGAFAYFPSEPNWEISVSPDGSTLYTGEVIHDEHNYGMILVKLSEDMGSDSTAWEGTLTAYIEFLNGSVFEFKESTPLGYGHTLESHPAAIGVIEYGVDKDNSEFKVKGWANSRFIAIMYVGNIKDMNMNFQELFLNGFRFPE